MSNYLDVENRAKSLLVHYFRILFEKNNLYFEGDNVAEIELIVEWIIEAAVKRVEEEMENHG
jgi:hypothetical protein